MLSCEYSSIRSRFSTERLRQRALTTLIPHTTSSRGSRFEVNIAVKFLRSGAFDVQNIITIPHAKLIRKLGNLTPDQLGEVEEIILFWLGFKDSDFDEEDEY
jgi:mRNA interferase MazF